MRRYAFPVLVRKPIKRSIHFSGEENRAPEGKLHQLSRRFTLDIYAEPWWKEGD